jgi:hypothetical protein
MHYALVLTKKRDVDNVTVPFVAEDGEIRRVELIVGWQTDMAVVSDDDPSDELLERDTILAIRAKAKSREVIRAQAFEGEYRRQVDWLSFDL